MLQVVVRPRKVRHVVAVEQPRPVASRDLEKVRDRVFEVAGPGPVTRHRTEESAHAAPHARAVKTVIVAKDTRGGVDPGVRSSHIGPEAGRLVERTVEDSPQPVELLGEPPF